MTLIKNVPVTFTGNIDSVPANLEGVVDLDVTVDSSGLNVAVLGDLTTIVVVEPTVEIEVEAAPVVSSMRGFSNGNSFYPNVGSASETDIAGSTLLTIATFSSALYVFFAGALSVDEVFTSVTISGVFASGQAEYTRDLNDASLTHDNSGQGGNTLWSWSLPDNMVTSEVYTVTFTI